MRNLIFISVVLTLLGCEAPLLPHDLCRDAGWLTVREGCCRTWALIDAGGTSPLGICAEIEDFRACCADLPDA